jgi:hypothetical protein
MIWIVLTFLGVPLWLCVVALIVLLRGRSHVKHITGVFRCKPRVVSGSLAGLKPGFPRTTNVGHWIHQVLVLHGGNPFLSRTTLCAVAALAGEPTNLGPGTVKGIDDPAAVRFRLDDGAILEIVCARGDLTALLEPFAGAPTPADATPTPPPEPGKPAS